MDLFEYQAKKALDASKPLAERMRPGSLNEFLGQRHIVGKGTLIRNAIENDKIFSMILWGPPGSGKTTIARIITSQTSSHFVEFSAVLSGVKQIRSVIDEAKKQQSYFNKRTILFVDEIHRFNKAQQDAFLHHVESGLITLIGATTENPSFEVVAALLSRCRVITLKPLLLEDIMILLKKAVLDKKRGLGNMEVNIEDDALKLLADIADGDARRGLNGLESAAFMAEKTETITVHIIESAMQKKGLKYDKEGEEHYNIISAFHKSMRGSDPDAAVYWLGRMLYAGEDPLYIARRMVRFASEDIGIADPNALGIALRAKEAFEFLGHPEGELPLFQAAVYLATAPKSNSIYRTFKAIGQVIEKTGALPVPMHIRNAPTKLMKNMGYGAGYKYSHDYDGAYVPQEYLPDELKSRTYFTPTNRGYEKIIKQRLDVWRKIKK
ncbi:MAG TPA: AAA family ATPase [Desulfobacteraceae bacterium]|nr:AAA family ATPase [Desulfobacteraceae bacterium]